MSKKKNSYVCQSCGYESPKWLGKCPECASWNTMTEEVVETKAKSASVHKKNTVSPFSLQDIPMNEQGRINTGLTEFDRVAGGGIVPGSVLLLSGAPGIGKSTLLLQIGSALASNGKKVLYISAEESLQQVRLRADRLDIHSDRYFLANETDVDQIEALILDQKPDLVIVDSIQTIFSDQMESLPGTVSQVRWCAHRLTQTAKTQGIPLILVGHVTKDGTIAGPRVLEHLVDTLLLFEGDQKHLYRLLRSLKNRFGSTQEVGLFEMTDQGVSEVTDPSAYCLSREDLNMPGTTVAVTIEGARAILVEIQALVTPTCYAVPQRTVTGFDQKKLTIILAVLQKRLGLKLATQDVFVNVAGGMRLSEPGVDMAVAMAILSSYYDQPIKPDTAFVGEIGLTGEIRRVAHIETRVSEASRLGFKHILAPEYKNLSNGTGSKSTLYQVKTLNEAKEKSFINA